MATRYTKQTIADKIHFAIFRTTQAIKRSLQAVLPELAPVVRFFLDNFTPRSGMPRLSYSKR
ncbi:hypothetical protein [Chitinophaga nivalis]|uniref:Uncharacterized protein n=1 Tax=Chitinophaga nivalis TaxID=2991709 RepID=A0ABT3IKG7_9BACT|nr:hypothetical protein [Chitinophaga nivalis]MCW3465853.1 hypothetical protein [Chitinophaga nivalis]MCW3484456.1 hypothetical protein [Chitinophaga nivalis]